MISGSDIVIVLSGGTANTNPSLSLGGDPSGYPVTSGINNLFNNINKQESESGHTDYRCIYVFNNSALYSLYDTDVFVSSIGTAGATKKIGIPLSTDQQKIVTTGTVTGGSFTLVYETGYPDLVVNWDSIFTNWIANLQNALNGLPGVSGVIVDGTSVPNSVQFIIRFEGASNHKQHPLLTLKTNNLVGNPVVTITKITDGSPINNIASPIAGDTITPAGITFGTATINIGILGPAEGFPIWIERHTIANVSPKYNDGFNLKVNGSPII